MVALSYKATQYGWFALKVFILVIAFAFMHRKFSDLNTASWAVIWETLQLKNLPFFLLFLGLATSNWLFEIKKWQVITSVIKKISFSEATRQSLAALTVSLATPNRIGDYGAKAMYFNKEERKKIVFLNFIANGFQFLITFFMGMMGVWKIFPYLENQISIPTWIGFFCVVIVICIMSYIFRKKEWFIKGLSIDHIWQAYKKLPSLITWKTLFFASLRYSLFSTLFYLLLQFYGAESSFLETIPFIFCMYLLVSIIPTFLVVDIIVRGSIAIGLLTILKIPETIIAATVFSMWLLNFLLPATIGSYYVLKFKRV
ncbi:MAG: hypothetical protein R2786_10210 [Flavobacteriaceae bacterium]